MMSQQQQQQQQKAPSHLPWLVGGDCSVDDDNLMRGSVTVGRLLFFLLFYSPLCDENNNCKLEA